VDKIIEEDYKKEQLAWDTFPYRTYCVLVACCLECKAFHLVVRLLEMNLEGEMRNKGTLLVVVEMIYSD